VIGEYIVIVLAVLTIIACIAYILNEIIRKVQGKSHNWAHVFCLGLLIIGSALVIDSSVMLIKADNIQRQTDKMIEQLQQNIPTCQ